MAFDRLRCILTPLATPDLVFHQERIARRVLPPPSALLQTVKCAAKSVAGLSARPNGKPLVFGLYFGRSGNSAPLKAAKGLGVETALRGVFFGWGNSHSVTKAM